MPPPDRRLTLCLTLVGLALASAPLVAADGDSDTTFSTDGKTTYTVSSPAVFGERASAVAALSDGSILVGGNSAGGNPTQDDAAVVKYLPSGTPDLDYGVLGSRIVDLDTNNYDSVDALFVETDGGVLIAGHAGVLPALARLTEGGDLDGTFGNSGTVAFEPPWPSAEASLVPVARRADSGRIVFAGYCKLCPANAAFRPFVLAVTSSGAPDPAFDGDGWAVLPIDLAVAPKIALDLDTSGRPILAVGSDATFSIWYMTDAGAPNPAWGGGDGRVDTLVAAGNPVQLIVEPALTRLYLYSAVGVYALHPTNGALDTSFGDQGVTWFNAWDEGSFVRRLALQSDGKLVGAGAINPVGTGLDDFFLIRLGTDGEPDPTFDGNGVRRVPFDLAADAIDVATTLTLSGGKPVVAGWATQGDGDERWAILRLENSLIFADGFGRGTTGAWAGF